MKSGIKIGQGKQKCFYYSLNSSDSSIYAFLFSTYYSPVSSLNGFDDRINGYL